MRRTIGFACILAGILMIAAALFLMWNNQAEDAYAGETVTRILPDVIEEIPDAKNFPQDDPLQPLPSVTVDVVDMSTEMTVTEIQGYGYIGYLSIPIINIELPVMSEWDYTRLRIAPCRQVGSTKSGDLVIAAHNYDKHFGRLHQLEYGDLLIFTDMDGVIGYYAVSAVETLEATQVDEMMSGEWDLTLYTCTYGGKKRITVRFAKIDEKAAAAIMEEYAEQKNVGGDGKKA